MSRSELIKKLKEKNPQLNNSDLENILDIFSKAIEIGLVTRKKIELRGFGTFYLKKLKEKRSARNPKTQELIYVPEKNKVRFRPSKKLKDFVNK